MEILILYSFLFCVSLKIYRRSPSWGSWSSSIWLLNRLAITLINTLEKRSMNTIDIATIDASTLFGVGIKNDRYPNEIDRSKKDFKQNNNRRTEFREINSSFRYSRLKSFEWILSEKFFFKLFCFWEIFESMYIT